MLFWFEGNPAFEGSFVSVSDNPAERVEMTARLGDELGPVLAFGTLGVGKDRFGQVFVTVVWVQVFVTPSG